MFTKKHNLMKLSFISAITPLVIIIMGKIELSRLRKIGASAYKTRGPQVVGLQSSAHQAIIYF